MIVIDSSFWLELFEGSEYGKIINENQDFINANFLVPSITVIEVYKKLLIERDSSIALIFATQMKNGKVIDLDFELSLFAAQNGKKYNLPLADSIIYATTIEHNATLYTLDKHFKDLPNVQYYQK